MRRVGWLLLWLGAAACSGRIAADAAGDPGAGDRPSGGGTSDGSVPGDAGPGVGPGGGASGSGDDGESPPGVGPTAFSCDDAAEPASTRFRRLTERQYDNTLADLLRWGLGDDALADQVRQALETSRARLPEDVRKASAEDLHGSYRRLDQDVAQGHVDAWFELAVNAGRELSAPARLRALAGECAVDGDGGDEAACVDDFLRSFGARALRRPLDAAERELHAAFYGDLGVEDSAGWADVIAGVLSAPQFLYLIEHGDAAVSDRDQVFALSAFELASRLSYHFWQTLPDEELWQAAEDRSLLEPDVLAAQVERLMADPRTRVTLAELFAEILQLDSVPELDAQRADPVFVAFAGSDLPGPELRQHAVDEALDMLAYFTWTAPAGVEALLTSELSFARGEDLARLYGVAPWDGGSAPPALPAGTRPGLLTRAWFLASGSANTRPIERGVFVRRQLLCDELPPPPANVNALLPEPRTDMTTRQSLEALTEQPGTACAGCHATAINPLGFAFEGFDALGRARTEQRLFEHDGREVGALQVDTTSVPRVTADDASTSTGPVDLARLMLHSGKVEACLARHYFRFAFGRREDLTADGCALEQLRARLVESGRIRDMLAEVASLPELGRRRFGP
jgi:hypothetical protein